jgi:predicted phage baseplate assembly protein
VVRQPTGEERQYGKIPASGRRIRFTSYRHGGGVIGNVGEKTIAVLKSSIPYIDSVTNFEKAQGGLDAETLEHAKIRAPRVLRSNTRAVTQDDFEFLALQANPRIARAKCFSASDSSTISGVVPGTVRLLLVPKPHDTDSYIPFDQLDVPQYIQEQVEAYLDERRLIGTRIDVGIPQYTGVTVQAQVRSKKGFSHQNVAQEVEKRLYQYINPVSGGLDGQGWPFGRSLSVAEVYAAMQGITGVDYIEEVRLIPVTPGSGQRHEATTKISIPGNGLICSDKHEITVVQ